MSFLRPRPAPPPPPPTETETEPAPKYDPSKAVPVGDILEADGDARLRRRKRRGEKQTPVLTGAAGDLTSATVLKKGLLGE